MSSLFSRITPANPQASGAPSAGSLFGTTSQSAFTAPAGSNNQSLFGSGNLTSNPQTTGASGGNLFGALGGSTAAPGPASLFNTSKDLPPTAESMFAANAASKSQPPADNGSVFGNNILPSSKNNAPSIVERPSNPEEAAAQPAYFQALLERGNKKRTSDENVGPYGNLPPLQLGLADISRKVRNIGHGGPSAGLVNRTDARSHYVLAASGVNANQALRDIEDLTGAPAPPQPALDEVDFSVLSGVKQSLAQHHQTNFQKMIQTQIQSAQGDFNRLIDEKLGTVDWDAHRQRIHEHFGLAKPANDEDARAGATSHETSGFGRASRRNRMTNNPMGQSFGLPGMAKSVIGAAGARGMRASVFGDVAEKMPDGFFPAPEDRVQRIKQEKYAGKVKDLNVVRLQDKVYPILSLFSEVEAETSNEDTSMLVNAYKALMAITGEDPSKERISDPGAVRQRQYARVYLDDAQSGEIRKRIISGSRNFLENHFLRQADLVVEKNPKEAHIGGEPSALSRMKGYVRVRAARKELSSDMEMLQELNGDYCWPVIFYLLRSGLHREALQYIEENQTAFRQIDRSFMRYLRAYVTSEDHRLPQDMQTAINNEYSQRQRLAPEDSIDPYRMMCYKVVGRCDLQRRSLDNITNDMLDWTWLQFALAREYSRTDEFAYEAFGLNELRQSIKDIGERYFGPGGDIANAATTFFFMQILAGMFEKAVADLYPHNYVSAVHFAIALDFYGFLRVSDFKNSDDLLTFTTRQEPQLAFGAMIGLYTRDFRTANATAAVDYLTLICLNDDLTGQLGQAQRGMCHQAITEVVLETRGFAHLLGDVRSDGQRIRGAVEQRLRLIGLDSQKDYLKHITLVAARAAEEQSRVTDAALLFHLAENYDKVMEVINEALSISLTTELGSSPVRLTPLKPRAVEQADGAQAQPETHASLSLTAVDDPIVLARSMAQLYNAKQMYSEKIRQETWSACRVLLQLADGRAAFENARWDLAIDNISNAGVLPTAQTASNLASIRQAAQSFEQMPVVVSRTIGHVMVWTVLACSNQIKHLQNQEFETGAQHEVMARCTSTAKNIMVFAGLIRYKLPGRVWEMLAQAGQDLEAH